MASSVRAKPLLAAAVLFALALILAPTALAKGNGGFVPVTPESPNAHDIRTSYFFITFFTLGVFVIVETLLVLFIFRFRRRRRPRFEDGPAIHGATRLELLWTAFPVTILFLIAAFIFIELPGISHVPSAGATGKAFQIKVTGRQFYWQFEYPNGAISIDTMRAPANVPVKLTVVSPDNDVIHSWWVPALGGKIDAIPGIVNTTWFKAKPGHYTGQCAELCGLQHAHMLAAVDVLPQAQFAAWLRQRRAQQTAVTGDLGQEEWSGVCAKCHGLAGQGGVAVRIAGSAILSDRQQLDSIVHNGITLPKGTMPPVGSDWTDEQVAALARYLKEHPPSGS
jgi:cytochrome c oxidase subunit II